MKMLVAYDGSTSAKEALRHGIRKVREEGGELVALSIFENNMYIDYDALPYAADKGRRDSARYADEAVEIIRNEGAGIKASIIIDEGEPITRIIENAREERADMLLCPPRYSAVMKQFVPSAEDGLTAGAGESLIMLSLHK